MRAVVYSLLATAIILFLTFSPSPSRQKNPNHLNFHRRIGINHAPFDPLIAKLIIENSNSNTKPPPTPPNISPIPKNPFMGIFEDPEEYFTSEGEFNIKGRLQILFPLLDNSPEDGSLSLNELERWNLQQASDQLTYRTLETMNEIDKDRDGAITFEEYFPKYSNEDINRNDMTHGQAGWWKEKFDSADADENEELHFAELMDFLHPEDSINDKVQLWSSNEKIRGMDYDKDGKLNFVEFQNQAYDNYKNNFEFETGGDDVLNVEEKFQELDVNKDGLLTQEELKPIIHYLHQGELTHAKHYSKYLIHQADEDGDGELTLNEMLNHEHMFYNTVITNKDYDDFHYEL
ncbi:hypothetical protein ACHQM5_000118 [Ranunculus cassubicifolius]